MKLTAIVSALVLGITSIAVLADEAPKLGLAERRALKEYQEKTYPDLLKEIQTAAGFEVPVEVPWEKIALPGKADLYQQPIFWTDIYFKPLAQAFAEITKDEMGKAALKEKLKSIVIVFDDDAPVSDHAAGMKFDDGVLTIDAAPYVNGQDLNQRAEAIVKTLEPKL